MTFKRSVLVGGVVAGAFAIAAYFNGAFEPKPTPDKFIRLKVRMISGRAALLVEGQDHYHRLHGRYSFEQDSLMVRHHHVRGRPYRLLPRSEYVNVEIVEADSVRWRAVLTHDSLPGLRCVYSDSTSNRTAPDYFEFIARYCRRLF